MWLWPYSMSFSTVSNWRTLFLVMNFTSSFFKTVMFLCMQVYYIFFWSKARWLSSVNELYTTQMMMPSFSKAWQFYCTKRPPKCQSRQTCLLWSNNCQSAKCTRQNLPTTSPSSLPSRALQRNTQMRWWMQIECNIISPWVLYPGVLMISASIQLSTTEQMQQKSIHII